jgi:S1-C subfamily serine protease
MTNRLVLAHDRRRPVCFVAAAACAWLAAGCSAQAAPTAAAPPTPLPVVAAVAAVAEVAGAGAAGGADAAAPAVAYVESSLGTGSAVLLEAGRLLTNAHVVWPDQTVRVVFPSGAEYPAAPVTELDLMADLAVVSLDKAGGGPVGLAPMRVADVRGAPVGTELYLVGYPGESESNPQPALSRGVLSRVRTWTALGLTYLQSDAAIAGGQSGGALVDAKGQLVGVSCMTFGDAASFGLALSAVDARDRMRRMEEGQDVDGVSARVLPRGAGARQQRVSLADSWSEAAFVGWLDYGDSLEAQILDRQDATVEVLDPYGELVASSNDSRRGPSAAQWTATDPGPHVVVAYADAAGSFDLVSSVPLVRFEDPDDNRQLPLGQTLTGSLDFPGDRDLYYVDLRAGDAVTVTVDTVGFFPDVELDSVDSALPAPRMDPEVAGALGLTLTAKVAAAAGGRYALVVRDPDDLGGGGYMVSVRGR